MAENTRAFIAVELDHKTHEILKHIQNDLKSADAEVRWVKPGNIHLTLKFLGDVPHKKMKKILETFPGLCATFHSFETVIKELGVFPDPKRPRVVWAGMDDPAGQIKSLAARIEEDFAKMGFRKEREFVPHLTLGRVKSEKNIPQLAEKVASCRIEATCRQTISRIVLFKSTLSSQGSIYEPLSVIGLKEN